MISSIDLLITKSDIILSGSVILILNIFQHLFTSQPLFSEHWINLSLGTLFGFFIHGLITTNISLYIIKNIDTKNKAIKRSIYDFVRFATVFIIQHLVINYIETDRINFNNLDWIEEAGLVITGFIAYNFLNKYIFKFNGENRFLTGDLLKISFGYLLAYIVMDGTVKNDRLISYLGMLSGVFVYHLFARRFGYSQDNFGLILNSKQMKN